MDFSKSCFYDDPSFDYQKYWQGREYEDLAEKQLLKKIILSLTNKESILDIGGGFGRLTPVYAPFFKKCFILDPSQKLLNQAKKLTKEYPNLFLKRGVVEKIPFPDSFFQVVLCIRTFHHLTDVSCAIKEIYRVLKPQGFLILEFANKIRFKNILKAIFTLNFDFFTNHLPENISSQKEIPFISYHPNQIKTLLLSNGFIIKKTFSVSNFRHPLLKKIIPLNILLKMEEGVAFLSAKLKILTFFGPSIFIIAQKKK
ncbi:MAG: class I SAM-dependent methyltransferase [Microgenomates group bacterium]